jgi:hypothetical protein
MSILIGGSPSTGSSLLRRILNRHPLIFCGSETSIFAKAEIYDDWPSFKSKLFKKSFFGISNAGWHNFTGVDIGEDYPVSKSEARTIAQHSDTLIDFTTAFFGKCLENSGKKIWAEKTPSNAFTLARFLDIYKQEAKVVHTVRHPLDAISSLHNRGMTLYNALSVYLLNVSQAQQVEQDARAMVIKYEDLVSSPKQQLELLWKHLEVADPEKEVLQPQEQESGVTKMEGWKSEETAAPNTQSIGRFAELPLAAQRRLMAGIELLTHNLDAPLKDIRAVAHYYGYQLPDPQAVKSEDYNFLNTDRETDIKKRRYSRAYFRAANYPIILRAL